jgi:lysophospholipase L1-like esterase
MAWYTGKSEITVIAIGDSNVVGAPFVPDAGVQTQNTNTFYWANDGAIPYVQSGHSWQTLDPSAASRLLQFLDAAGDTSVYPPEGIVYMGQTLGDLGSPSMQAANTIQQGTGIPVYTLLTALGGSTSSDLIGWLWSQIETQIPLALAEIPSNPTYADVIYISVGGGDLLWGSEATEDLDPTNWRFPYTAPTAQEFYENVAELRARMIAGGWWVPGTTQIVINEIPRNGAPWFPTYPAWQGLAYMLSRFNDRIAMVSSVGRTYDPLWPVHYSPESYTDMGREAGELVVAQIPRQRAVFSVGGSRLSVGGQKLRVHSA